MTGNARRATAMLLTFGVFAVAGPAAQPSSEAPRPKPSVSADLTAEDVAKRVAGAYADLRSYRDRGEITIESTRPSQKPLKRIATFSTVFDRSSMRFKCEYEQPRAAPGATLRDSKYHSAAWGNDGGWFHWNSQLNKVTKCAAASDAYGDYSHSTWWSSSRVPSMLLKSTEKRGPFAVPSLRLEAKSESHEGRPCLVLTTDPPGESVQTPGQGDPQNRNPPVRFWVDRTTWMLVKVVQEDRSPTVTYKVTTTYRPTSNPQIPDSEFKFEPPKPPIETKPAGQK